ncbi:hypothetical protein ES703_12808 [subsurface metagenome]
MARAKGIMEAVEGILYPYAMDKAGSIVKAVYAPRHGIYSCISCGERMVLRRGEIKRPYFAHYTENSNCKPETMLHMMAKDIIKAGLDTAIKMKYEYPFTWHCPVCDQEHKGNLARSTREVKTEVSLDGVRPDILVRSMKEKPLVAIEVIVTHRPGRRAINAYKWLKLPVLIKKTTWDDLKNLSSGLSMVEAWQAPCRAKTCPKCGKAMKELEIAAFKGISCSHCGKPMLVMGLSGNKGDYFKELTPGVIKPAMDVGVLMREEKPPLWGYNPIMHICPGCGALQCGKWGEREYITDSLNGRRDIEKRKEYYRCETCDLWIEKIRAANSMTAQEPLNPCEREKGPNNE